MKNLLSDRWSFTSFFARRRFEQMLRTLKKETESEFADFLAECRLKIELEDVQDRINQNLILGAKYLAANPPSAISEQD